MNFFTNAFNLFFGILMYGGMLLLGLGGLYWLWVAIQIGSFMMFVVGLFPLFYIVTVPVGAWSILFGVPDWVFRFFG
ncbi:hypothetical protein OR573_06915 [Halomonas sp. CH40]